MSKRPALRWASVFVVVLAAILLPFAFFERSITAWSTAALARPPTVVLAIVVAGLLAADVLLPVPSSLVSTASGALFGFAGGAFVSWAGMMLGCVVGWALGRSVGRAGLRRYLGEDELARAERIGERFGSAALVVSRPVPVLAEASVLFAGACGVPFWRTMALSALANAGISLAYAAVGAFSARIDSFLLAFAGAMGLPAIALGIAHLARRERASA
jgi:uncharacterized membrane protein YdjX (TVP38/TMEM64 family)